MIDQYHRLNLRLNRQLNDEKWLSNHIMTYMEEGGNLSKLMKTLLISHFMTVEDLEGVDEFPCDKTTRR